MDRKAGQEPVPWRDREYLARIEIRISTTKSQRDSSDFVIWWLSPALKPQAPGPKPNYFLGD